MKSSSILNFIRENDVYLILTHRNPDGDTLCSAAALCSALRRMGKTAYLYDNPGISDRFNEYVGKFVMDPDYIWTKVISVDTASETQFCPGFVSDVDLSIDHHPSNTHYARETFLKDTYSSCGEIICEIIFKLCGNLTKEEADLLYIAVSTDTGCFQYSNTNIHTMDTISKLLKAGAENGKLNNIFFRKEKKERLKLDGMILSNLSYHFDNRICVAVITKDMLSQCGLNDGDLDDVASIAFRAEGCCVAITIREIADGKCKVSVRSDDSVSSTGICSYFGGGGHKNAAGCTLNASCEVTKEMLLSVAQEVMR